MDELIRGMADLDGDGLIRWRFMVTGTDATEVGAHDIYNAIDTFLLDHPGHRVIVAIEREPGERIPSSPDSLLPEGPGV